jgi:uncharacterized protein with NAD-binding domain and iron-sulfur cluster
MSSKRKIAVLGGGVGAMSAVFELTSVPGWDQRFEITVYQMGWRLGGKGASGRDRAVKDRIYEHGLHLWMGFYENAFRQIRDAYREWNTQGYAPKPGFADFQDAFAARNYAPAMDQVDGNWTAWLLDFPPNNMAPGQDLPPPKEPFGFWDLTLRMVGNLLEAYLGVHWQTGIRGFLLRLASRLLLWFSHYLRDHPWLAKLVDFLIEHAPHPEFLLPLAYAHAHTAHADPARRQEFLSILECFIEWFSGQSSTNAEHTEGMRRLGVLFDTAIPLLRGIIQDQVVEKGYDQLDDEDFLEWLARHGSREPNNAITKYFYDACLAYRQGRNEYHPDVPGPQRMGLNMGAGAVLYGLLRLVGSYKGALMFVMRAGMGDTIFSPFYVVLKNRGVKFEFFHKVLNLRLTPDKSAVEAIEMDVQAKVKPEFAAAGYQPIYDVKGVACWPNEPLWDQLQNADELRKRPPLDSYWDGTQGRDRKILTVGVEFEEVLLGISVGALPYICSELVAHNPKWRAMVDNVITVKTQAMQLWLHRTMAELGWPHPSPILTGFVEPHDTWSDMTQVLPRESWTPADDIRQIAYFCNVMPECTRPQCSIDCLPHRRVPGCPMSPPFTDTAFPGQQKDLVRAASIAFLQDPIRVLWPKFDFSALLGGSFEKQFWRVNLDPPERYVQNIAGSSKYRLRSDESGFANLVMAGDWTYTPINIGCVEAAVISGKMASYALCGKPDFIYGPMGYPAPMSSIGYPLSPQA